LIYQILTSNCVIMETIGGVASIAQLVGMAAQLSISLYSLSDQLKAASHDIRVLAIEISLYGETLSQLAEVLSQSSHQYMPRVYTTASRIMDACGDVFAQVDTIVTGLRGSTFYFSKTGNVEEMGKGITIMNKVKWVFKQRRIALIRARMESQKTLLLLMLKSMSMSRKLAEQGATPSMASNNLAATTMMSLALTHEAAVKGLEKLEDDDAMLGGFDTEMVDEGEQASVSAVATLASGLNYRTPKDSVWLSESLEGVESGIRNLRTDRAGGVVPLKSRNDSEATLFDARPEDITKGLTAQFGIGPLPELTVSDLVLTGRIDRIMKRAWGMYEYCFPFPIFANRNLLAKRVADPDTFFQPGKVFKLVLSKQDDWFSVISQFHHDDFIQEQGGSVTSIVIYRAKSRFSCMPVLPSCTEILDSRGYAQVKSKLEPIYWYRFPQVYTAKSATPVAHALDMLPVVKIEPDIPLLSFGAGARIGVTMAFEMNYDVLVAPIGRVHSDSMASFIGSVKDAMGYETARKKGLI
jgi:hypothetical protein